MAAVASAAPGRPLTSLAHRSTLRLPARIPGRFPPEFQDATDAVAAASWLEVVEAPPDAALLAEIEVGEAAAIPLAQRLGAVLLCDDTAARVVARSVGVHVVGTLGVLLQAKRSGNLPQVAPTILSMRDLGMFISDALMEQVLTEAGER